MGSVAVPILKMKKQEHRKVKPKDTQLGVVEWDLNPDSPALASEFFPPHSPTSLSITMSSAPAESQALC